MTMTEARRFEMHEGLRRTLGQETAVSLVEHLPPTGWGDVATKSDVEMLRLEMNLRFENVDARFVSIDARFESIDRRFDSIDTRFDLINSRFESIDARFDLIDARFKNVDERFETIPYAIRAAVAEASNKQIKWTIGAIVTWLTIYSILNSIL